MTVAWLIEAQRTLNSMHNFFLYKIDPSYTVCGRTLSIIFQNLPPPGPASSFRWTGIFRKGRVVPLFLNCNICKKANVCSKLASLRASHSTQLVRRNESRYFSRVCNTPQHTAIDLQHSSCSTDSCNSTPLVPRNESRHFSRVCSTQQHTATDLQHSSCSEFPAQTCWLDKKVGSRLEKQKQIEARLPYSIWTGGHHVCITRKVNPVQRFPTNRSQENHPFALSIPHETTSSALEQITHLTTGLASL